MTEHPTWKEIFKSITENHQVNNFANITSHLEELYVLIADLNSEVEQLKKDNELLKSYAWEK